MEILITFLFIFSYYIQAVKHAIYATCLCMAHTYLKFGAQNGYKPLDTIDKIR